ncbi:MAG: lipopolysaccharide assembly protein LapB, partial [Oxalobacteraceae bacterium]|nr:lipopolysaccharide assembly protein LapB [Oxalobacteraceae bacterium]
MEFEVWWLVSIPFFFALGWIAARVDIRHVISESRRLPRSYYQGLNALLDEDPDKAIDAFVEIARL